jgi:predicted RNase H-related nuclease YkuK (DUF458 family)
MSISRSDLNAMNKEQLRKRIEEDPNQHVECPVEMRHLVKIEHIEAHISNCLRVPNSPIYTTA